MTLKSFAEPILFAIHFVSILFVIAFLSFFLSSPTFLHFTCSISRSIDQVTQYIFYGTNNYSFRCQPTDFSTSPNGMYEARLSYLYFILKIADFLDTIFFILRKKTSHVSFLHVYHHVMIALGAYVCVIFATGMFSYSFCCLIEFNRFACIWNLFDFVFSLLFFRGRMSAGGQGILLGYLNSFVHAVMYLYYLLSIWMPQVKSSSLIKQNITRLQMVNCS